jgi:hypothetical protein
MRDPRLTQTVLCESPKLIGVSAGDLTLSMSEKVETLPGRWRSLVDIWRSGQGTQRKVFSAEVEPFALISLKNGEWVEMLERFVAGRLN